MDSVTHAHLVYVLAQEFTRRRTGRAQIVDAGCGNGNLMLALHRHLNSVCDIDYSVGGFDVSDARIQRSDFFRETEQMLQSEAPDVVWRDRLVQVPSGEPWPYESQSADAIVTNQVLEHVKDFDHFLDELDRILKPGGFSVNLFPVRALLIEGHTGVPFAHRIASDDLRRAYMRLFAAAGLSRLGPMRMTADLRPTDFGRTRSEYVASQTSYRSFREIATAAHMRQLSISFRWTPHFYVLKLGYVLHRNVARIYQRNSAALTWEWLTFWLLSRLSSVTIVIEKDHAYDPDAKGAGHLGKRSR